MPLVVRDAEESDAPALAALWSELFASSGPGGSPARPNHAQPPHERVLSSLRRLASDAAARIVVAEVAGTVAGCAYLRELSVSPVHEDRVVHVSHLHVDGDFARLGVGRSLIESALGWAEELGVETIVAATSPSDREANRFLARQGLSQVAALRGGSVAGLRTRLRHDAAVARRGGLRSARTVGRVVALRRSQRRGRSQATGPEPSQPTSQPTSQGASLEKGLENSQEDALENSQEDALENSQEDGLGTIRESGRETGLETGRKAGRGTGAKASRQAGLHGDQTGHDVLA